MIHLLFTTLLATLAIAAPLEKRATGPSVTIQNGTVIGATNNGIDSFKGIPFAQPPVGNLRLKPPQSVNASFGTLMATGSPMACPQQYVQDNSATLAGLPDDVVGMVLDTPLFQQISNAGEDCLTIQIYRPANTTSDSKLPVAFWIFGGRSKP